MNPKLKCIAFLLLTLSLFAYSPAFAQDGSELTLSWSRDFGYSSGSGDIQGVFSLKAKGPENMVSVQFFVDDTLIGTATEDPFKVQFSTDNHPLGKHSIYAVATLSDGSELRSRDYERVFVAAGEGMEAAFKIIIPVLGLVLAIVLLSYIFPLLANRGKRAYVPPGTQRNYGWMGGTICPRCKRPFAIHFLSINLSFTGRLDYCPHCGKWSFVRRTSLDELRRAEQAELADAAEGSLISGTSAEEKLRKELDDSRFQGF